MRRVGLLPLAGAAMCAGLAFHPIFAWPDLLRVVLPAALVPAVLALLLGSRPLWMSLLANLVAWITGAYVLFGGSVSAQAVAAGLRNGWRTILATVPPLPGKPELLVLVLTCTWLGAMAGAELVARTRRPLLATLPVVAVLGLACLLTAGSNVYVVGGLAMMAGLLALRRTRWLAGLPIIAGSTAVAMLVLSLVSWPAKFDPRQQVAKPEPRLQRAISPLDLIAPWLRDPDRELFSVQSAQSGNWRLAVFDRFNGVSWSSSALFQPTGGTVPSTVKGPLRTDRITIASLPGPWLPAADRPAMVAGVPVQVDPTTGVLISVDSLRPGMQYEVSSVAPEPDPATLRTAATATDPVDLPSSDSVDELRQTAHKATAGAAYPYQQAALLEKHMRENFKFDASATPGHNMRALHLFVATTQRGTSEQFATAYAVMARALGLPSRVVVGFRPGLEQAGTWHVRTGDVLAWPEINFAGAGWVPFFPTPEFGQSTSDSPGAGAPPKRQELNRQVVQEAQRQSITPPVAVESENVAPVTPAAPRTGRWWNWGYLLLIPALYVSLVLTVPFWRMRRQRRLSAPDQISAAWRRVGRRLTPMLTDVPHVSSLTNSELAVAGLAVLGEASRVPLTTLATLADQTHFGRELITPQLAGLAWQRLQTLERLVWRRTNPLRRLHPRRFTD